MRPLLCLTLSLAMIAAGCSAASRSTGSRVSALRPHYTARPLVQINDNGAWCWFQNERAIVHGDDVIVGSIANRAGPGGATRGGDVDVAVWHLAFGSVRRATLHPAFENDDHDAPAIHLRQDGRLVVIYGKHNTDRMMHWRVSDAAGDYLHFGPEQTLDAGAGYTYQNVYRLSAESGRVYNFHRGVGFNPNYLLSDDDGLTWRYGGRLIDWPKPPANDPKFTGLDGGRPYARYASNGVESIHVLVTEDHPRAYDNSIWHGVIRGGQILRSDGSLVAPLSTDRENGVKPSDLTCVYAGDADHVAWTSDIRLDKAGLPYVTFSVQMNDAKHRRDPKAGGEDIRHWYARFDGTRWHAHEIAYGGSRLYSPEVDYSGLTTLHPYDPDTVYLSTNADPATGKPLISSADGKRHYELFRGHTGDGGATFAWTPITANSSCDNLRPIVPPGDQWVTVVLWFRGTYRSYTDYSTEVVGMVEHGPYGNIRTGRR